MDMIFLKILLYVCDKFKKVLRAPYRSIGYLGAIQGHFLQLLRLASGMVYPGHEHPTYQFNSEDGLKKKSLPCVYSS